MKSLCCSFQLCPCLLPSLLTTGGGALNSGHWSVKHSAIASKVQALLCANQYEASVGMRKAGSIKKPRSQGLTVEGGIQVHSNWHQQALYSSESKHIGPHRLAVVSAHLFKALQESPFLVNDPLLKWSLQVLEDWLNSIVHIELLDGHVLEFLLRFSREGVVDQQARPALWEWHRLSFEVAILLSSSCTLRRRACLDYHSAMSRQQGIDPTSI